MTYTIELWGEVNSKKNNLMPVRRGKGLGLAYNQKSRKSVDDLMVQVPGSVRNLNLEHPDLDFYFTVPNGRSDRDGMVVTVLDLLVKSSTLRNDAIASLNGRLTIHPAVISDHWKTVIVLTTKEGRESEDSRPLLSTD